MFELSSLFFALELLICENVLLFGCEKRKYFWIREIIAVLLCLGFAYLFPVPGNLKYNNWYMWLKFLVIFILTSGQALVCYKIKILPLFAFCTSGYAIQHISFHIFNLFFKIPFNEGFAGFLSEFSIYCELFFVIIFAIVAFFTLGRVYQKRQYYKNYNHTLSVIAIWVILIITGITRLVRSESFSIPISSSIYAIVTCGLALFIQTTIYRMIEVSNENKVIRRMRENDRIHFEIAKSTIENINIKAHDIKHMLLESPSIIDEEEKKKLLSSIEFYDQLKTGNGVIDIVLMDYKLRCSKEGVRYTFSGNGSCLNFVRDIDLASIFGNAIANASDAVAKLENKEMRNVSITVEEKGDLIFVTFRNYFDGEIKFDGRYPITSKQEHKIDHGFGLKSIHSNVEKYGGDINISTSNNIFILSIYFCKPKC